MYSKQEGEDKFILSFLHVRLISFSGESFLRFSPLLTGVFPVTRRQPDPFNPSPPDTHNIYDTHCSPKLPNMKDMDEEQSNDI